MEKTWKDIKGYENVYQVSNTGKVRRIGKYSNQHSSWKAKRELKAGDNGKGYKFVNLSKNNNQKQKYIHRLVAQAFIEKPKCDEYLTVNHKDGNKNNNNVNNLEWATQSENNQHAYDVLNKKSLKNNPKVSKKIIQFDLDNNKLKQYPSIREAERQTNINSSSISEVCRNIRNTAGGFKWKYQKV